MQLHAGAGGGRQSDFRGIRSCGDGWRTSVARRHDLAPFAIEQPQGMGRKSLVSRRINSWMAAGFAS